MRRSRGRVDDEVGGVARAGWSLPRGDAGRRWRARRFGVQGAGSGSRVTTVRRRGRQCARASAAGTAGARRRGCGATRTWRRIARPSVSASGRLADGGAMPCRRRRRWRARRPHRARPRRSRNRRHAASCHAPSSPRKCGQSRRQSSKTWTGPRPCHAPSSGAKWRRLLRKACMIWAGRARDGDAVTRRMGRTREPNWASRCLVLG
jgi:hypothetical protein